MHRESPKGCKGRRGHDHIPAHELAERNIREGHGKESMGLVGQKQGKQNIIPSRDEWPYDQHCNI